MTFTDTTIWIIQTFFTIYLVILWLRILLSVTDTSSANSLSQLIFSLTNLVLWPFQKILPVVKGIDLAVLFVIFLVELLGLYLVGYLQTEQWLNFPAMCLWAVGQALDLLLAIFIWSIIIEVLFSWISLLRQRYYTIQDVLHHLTAPMLKPIQWVLPTVLGRWDFSPIIALIILFLAERYLTGPIVQYAIIWAFNSSIDIV